MDRYKPGDTVKIRSWDSMKNEFGVNQWGAIDMNIVFVPHMRRNCGKIMRISCYEFDNLGYLLQNTDPFVFSLDMFVGGDAEC